MDDLTACVDLRGRRIDLTFTRTAAATRTRLRVVRRRFSYPTGPEDGLAIDFEEMFWSPANRWTPVERTRYLTPNSPAEGGLCQAEVSRYMKASLDIPGRIIVSCYDAASQSMKVYEHDGIVNLIEEQSTVPNYLVTTTQIIVVHDVDVGEQLSGTFSIYTSTVEGQPHKFEHAYHGGAPTPQVIFSVEWDRAEVQTTTDTTPEGSTQDVFSLVTDMSGQRIRAVSYESSYEAAAGTWSYTLRLQDEAPSQRKTVIVVPGLEPETTYYYTVYAETWNAALNQLEWVTMPTWKASATTTGTYGLVNKLYDLLPAIHRAYDEPEPNHVGTGQLRRFLQIFGTTLDHVRGLSEGLLVRHDLIHVRAEHLRYLARWIGWEPDQTLPDRLQRSDISFAPEIFSTVGTTANIVALVNRTTGWDCEIHEFGKNVFYTNSPETSRSWEIWQTTVVVNPNEPSAQTTAVVADSFDGRPAVVRDASNNEWIFYHSNRFGRREIVLQKLDQPGTLRRAAQGASDDAAFVEAYTDENPAVVRDGSKIWLFWDSNRTGTRELWMRTYTDLSAAGTKAVRLTDHAADDSHPAAVRETTGDIWLFWQSNRRGPTDVWGMKFVSSTGKWDPPQRITTGQPRDHTPCAALSGGTSQVWLLWSRDQGDRSRICYSYLDPGGFEAPEYLTDDLPMVRNESPAAVLWQGKLVVLWHSNQGGRWDIWGRVNLGGGWGVWNGAYPLLTRSIVDKEPAALVDISGNLRIFFRSQRGGARFRSRTLDTADLSAMKRGQPGDLWHYIYDTRKIKESWYARNAVGLYMTPPPGGQNDLEKVERVRSFLDPFRPVTARFVWFLNSSPV